LEVCRSHRNRGTTPFSAEIAKTGRVPVTFRIIDYKNLRAWAVTDVRMLRTHSARVMQFFHHAKDALAENVCIIVA